MIPPLVVAAIAGLGIIALLAGFLWLCIRLEHPHASLRRPRTIVYTLDTADRLYLMHDDGTLTWVEVE